MVAYQRQFYDSRHVRWINRDRRHPWCVTQCEMLKDV